MGTWPTLQSFFSCNFLNWFVLVCRWLRAAAVGALHACFFLYRGKETSTIFIRQKFFCIEIPISTEIFRFTTSRKKFMMMEPRCWCRNKKTTKIYFFDVEFWSIHVEWARKVSKVISHVFTRSIERQ